MALRYSEDLDYVRDSVSNFENASWFAICEALELAKRASTSRSICPRCCPIDRL